MSALPARPRPLRQRIGNHKKTITMNNDTYERVNAFARRHNITWSGALHELVRTHPLIGLSSLLDAQKRIDAIKGTAWGKTAQVAGDYVRKGSKVAVVGRLESEQWTDRTSG
jgi:hypothetical protein